MNIEVRSAYDDEVLFEGNAEEYLEESNYDDELEDLLNRLDEKFVGCIAKFYDVVIEKLSDDNIYE